MKNRILGKDLEVSPIGLGCMGFSHAYGTATDEDTAINAIRQAVEMGYTFFDTAECYIGEKADGSISYNEELVGKALAPYRNQVKVATKCGVKHENRQLVLDSRPETIKASIEGSLKRLGMDHVDLYYQHRIDPNVEPEEVAVVITESAATAGCDTVPIRLPAIRQTSASAIYPITFFLFCIFLSIFQNPPFRISRSV